VPAVFCVVRRRGNALIGCHGWTGAACAAIVALVAHDADDAPDAEDDGMTISDFADMLQISADSVYRWIRAGRLRVGKLPSGRYARIPRSEVDRVLAEAAFTPGRQAP